MNVWIKIGLAVLLFGCLLPMPYGYFMAVRYLAMAVFAYLAFEAYEETKTYSDKVLIFIALSVLFQPFFKIALGRTLWNIVDVVVAIGLLASLFRNKKIENK